MVCVLNCLFSPWVLNALWQIVCLGPCSFPSLGPERMNTALTPNIYQSQIHLWCLETPSWGPIYCVPVPVERAVEEEGSDYWVPTLYQFTIWREKFTGWRAKAGLRMCGHSQGRGMCFSGCQKEESDGGSEWSRTQRRLPFSLKKRSKGKWVAGGNGNACIITPSEPKSTSKGASWHPQNESATKCKPLAQRENEKQCFQLSLPFPSLLPLSGLNNCGHEVALREKVLNLFKCHSNTLPPSFPNYISLWWSKV